MNLEYSEIVKSPNIEGNTRLVGEVTYDRLFLKPERMWFEVSDEYAEFLTDSGNPWLTCLIPLAVTLGESLRIGMPVDRELFENVQELLHIWKGWYPYLQIVPVEAETVDSEPRSAPARTASLFSGGVDSFHTVLHHDAGAVSGSQTAIDDLVFIWGFDVPLCNRNTFQRVRDSLQIAAADLGKELVVVSSNMRDTQFQQANLANLSHGSFLASAVLALEKRYSKVLIPSSFAQKNLHPWGSHPRTDPLHSTKSTTFIHYGTQYDRIEKTKYVSRSETALRSIRVCWRSDSGENCGACNKCYRTKLTLELVGALDRCTTFSEKSTDLKKVAEMYSSSERDIIYLHDIQTAALRLGREDIADAIDRSLQFSAHLDRRRLLPKIRKFNKFLQTKPTLWRLVRPFKKTLKFVISKITGSSF